MEHVEMRAIAVGLKFKPHVTPSAQQFIVKTIARRQGVIPYVYPNVSYVYKNVLPESWVRYLARKAAM